MQISTKAYKLSSASRLQSKLAYLCSNNLRLLNVTCICSVELIAQIQALNEHLLCSIKAAKPSYATAQMLS